MSAILLNTLNYYVNRDLSAEDAAVLVATVGRGPIPESLDVHDWRAHVPMHLLEEWMALNDDERVAIYVMAQSATQSYDSLNLDDSDHDAG